MTSRCNVFALLCAGLLVSLAAGKITSEAEAQRYLAEYDRIQSRISNEASHIAWAYSTNMTEFNKQNMVRDITWSSYLCAAVAFSCLIVVQMVSFQA